MPALVRSGVTDPKSVSSFCLRTWKLTPVLDVASKPFENRNQNLIFLLAYDSKLRSDTPVIDPMGISLDDQERSPSPEFCGKKSYYLDLDRSESATRQGLQTSTTPEEVSLDLLI